MVVVLVEEEEERNGKAQLFVLLPKNVKSKVHPSSGPVVLYHKMEFEFK